MTVEFWTNAERFYEFWLTTIGGMMVILLAVFIVVAMGEKKENKNKILFGLFISSMFLIGAGLLGHFQYRPYLDLSRYVNPQVRDGRLTYFGYSPFTGTDQAAYSQINSLDTLREFELYDEIEVSEVVEYLGQDAHYYYFELENEMIVKQFDEVDFDETVEEAQFVGSQFELIDPNYMEIGFKNIDRIMFRRVEVPAAEKEKVYEPEDAYVIPKSDERMHQWNF